MTGNTITMVTSAATPTPIKRKGSQEITLSSVARSWLSPTETESKGQGSEQGLNHSALQWKTRLTRVLNILRIFQILILEFHFLVQHCELLRDIRNQHLNPETVVLKSSNATYLKPWRLWRGWSAQSGRLSPNTCRVRRCLEKFS